MRIISSFHDYYDSIQKYGIDKTRVYERKLEEINPSLNEIKTILNILPYRKSYNSATSFSYLDINRITFRDYDTYSHKGISCFIYIGFCGYIYPCIHLIEKNNQSDFYAYSIEDLYSIGFEKEKDKHKYYSISSGNIELFFKPIKSNTIFELFQTPIFVLDSKAMKTIKINCSLKDYDFYKVFDSYRAYQELEMFTGDILRMYDENPVKISEKDMLKKKGFDKMSFRKYPTKKVTNKQ